MKKLGLLFLVLFSMNIYAQGHGVIGKWNTIDDATSKAMSVVEIFEYNNKIYGKVIEILNPKNRSKTCANCPGDDHNKPILGLTIIKGLVKDGTEYNNGKILDPKDGKEYKCSIWVEGGKLKVKGKHWTGLSKTQTWLKK